MPQIIRCPECNQQLKVPDDFLGKKMRCPACKAVFATAPPEPPPPPPPDAIQSIPPPPAWERDPEEKPRQKLPRKPSWEDDDDEEPRRKRRSRSRFDDVDDDEDEPRRRRRFDRRTARKSVTAYTLPPAICLLVTGGLSIVANLFEIIIAIADPPFMQQQNNIFGPDPPIALRVFIALVWMIFALITVAGGVCMIRTEGYGFALAGAIVAMINIGTCCFLLGLPFGIWALVILCQANVKRAFGVT